MKTLSKIAVARTLAVAVLCGVGVAPAAFADGVVPETSVVLVDEATGEGTIDVKNTDPAPVLMHVTLENIPQDDSDLLFVTPPVARVDAGETQRVRFLLKPGPALKTERLKRVTFEGIPVAQQKGAAKIRFNFRQNLPLIIRPDGLARNPTPWIGLKWSAPAASTLTVNNPSAYVVRLTSPWVQLLPSQVQAMLPRPYILPGETLTAVLDEGSNTDNAAQVRIAPATTYGYAVDSYDAPLGR